MILLSHSFWNFSFKCLIKLAKKNIFSKIRLQSLWQRRIASNSQVQAIRSKILPQLTALIQEIVIKVDKTVGEKMIREASPNDLDELLHLYLSLHETAIPEKSPSLQKVWQRMVEDPDHHIIVKVLDGKIVSSCICVVIPNLTRGLRPYALIENVVTHHDFRGKGHASECLDFAKKIATEANCYKTMLMTGSKKESTWEFYKRAGYNHQDKKAFIQWLD